MGDNHNGAVGQQTRTLCHKRILVTDIENDFGRELYTILRGEGCLIFTLVRECRRMQQVVQEFPDVLPILLDLNMKDGGEEGRKCLVSLPTLDHIINLSGDVGLDVVSKAYGNWKINEIGENKAKPLISKMKDAGSRGLIFHSTLIGNHNLMSKLKANLNPRYTDSTTAQVSTSVRKSLKKLFSTEPQPPMSTTNSGPLSQSIANGANSANAFAALANSLSNSNSDSNSRQGSPTKEMAAPTPADTNRPSGSTTARNPGQQPMCEKNLRIRQTAEKLSLKTIKKWGKLLKEVEKDQLSQLKKLERDIQTLRKREKTVLMSQNASANASTAARRDVLSAETAGRIMASREARVDREVDKKAEKKRDEDTVKLAENKQVQLETLTNKLYHKIVLKEINEFTKLKQKHLMT